jgi:L-aminopeptidase/D-esterase-like protein
LSTGAANATLTAVPGIRVGHATAPQGRTGCTVVLGPFRGAVELSGLATGTRELGALDPRHLVARIDALLLTGGSAFGLAAADGVSGWLAERGIGFDTGVALVPIVPAAVIFDLAEGVPRPDAALGRHACTVASGAPVEEGRVGAGAGATVGKLAGRERSSPGGLGTAAGRLGPHAVGALAVVNALGNVSDRSGRIVAGARGERPGEWLDTAAAQGSGAAPGFARSADGPRAGTNTTLAVVATDAPLSRGELARVVRVAATALARRIDPVHTPFDGDVVFALSTAREVSEIGPAESLALGVALRDLLEEAIIRAVTVGRPAGA